VTIYNHRASNSVLKILIDYVPFDMAFSGREKIVCAGKKMEAGIFFCQAG
jgi:hypothetical protein